MIAVEKGHYKSQLTSGNITFESYESVGLKEKLLGVRGFQAGVRAV